MTKMENVINGLECCLNADMNDCEMDCPYFNDCGGFYSNNTALLADALALLKAQGPVEPQEKREGDYKNLYCGACGRGIVGYVGHLSGKHFKVSDYCYKCGRAVKW